MFFILLCDIRWVELIEDLLNLVSLFDEELFMEEVLILMKILLLRRFGKDIIVVMFVNIIL